MAWLAVDKQNVEFICDWPPKRYGDHFWILSCRHNNMVTLPKGSIKKLIGRDLTWHDEPVEI